MVPYSITSPDQLLNASVRGLENMNFDYDYPRNLKLKPGSELHQKILSRLLRYGWESARVISQRRPVWDAMNDKLQAYIPLDAEEKAVRSADPRKPIGIVFPYSFAILETLLSYLVAAFFPDPMFRYEGTAPEDIAGATLMEKVINLHVARTKVALNLHTFFRDACAYGFGVVSPQWCVKSGKRERAVTPGTYDGLGNFTPTGVERVREEAVLFEGNELANIDPYSYLPDPNYPLHEPQRGEYVGWMDRTSYMDLLDEELDNPDFFNVRYLRAVHNKGSRIFGSDQSRRVRSISTDATITMDRNVSDPIDQFHCYVKLIPSVWGLGNEDYPQKWLFTVASDAVVIRAKPLDLNHNMFPVAICAPDFDGYSPVAYSRLEILSGMQTTIDWLFNSHITNVRKCINDMVVVDPYLVNVNDLKDPNPGKIIRLRRPAWGKGLLDNAVKQLNVNDITRANMQDVALIMQYMQQVGGTDNPLMGNLRRGGPERLTTAEFQGTSQGAVSRMERIAKVVGLQGMQDIGYFFASHTQQMMTQDVYVRTVGDWPAVIQREFNIQEGRVRVSPLDLLIEYDLITRDGSIPGGNFSDVWPQLFQTVAGSEQLMQRLDVVRIFKYIATNLGAKNVEDFELKSAPATSVAVAPDEQVQQQVERGNLVSLLGGG